MTDTTTTNTSEETQNNPYTAPEADLNTATSGNGITVFDRFSAWGVFGLMFITLGIYYVYWAYTRTQRINSVVENKISDAFILTTMGLYIVYFFASFATPFFGDSLGMFFEIAVGILGLAATILPIVWVFKIRNRINQVTGSEKGDTTWLGPVMTFFFSAIYLQYKINQNLDLLNSPNS